MALITQADALDASALEVGDVFVKAFMGPYGSGWAAMREYRVDRVTKRDVVCVVTNSPKALLRPNRSKEALLRLNRNRLATGCFAPDDPALDPIRVVISRMRAWALIKGMDVGDIDDELLQAIFAWRKRRDAKETVTPKPRG
jgi:hypothetical protein